MSGKNLSAPKWASSLEERPAPYSTPNKEQHFPGVPLSLLSLHPTSAKWSQNRAGSATWRAKQGPFDSAGRKPNCTLTFVRTEAVFAVFVEVGGGGAPQEAVVTALRRAAVVLGAHEVEGEFAKLALIVAKLHLDHCRKEQ